MWLTIIILIAIVALILVIGMRWRSDASGKPTFYMTPTDGKIAMPESSSSKTYVSPTECWQVLVGIKYLFN